MGDSADELDDLSEGDRVRRRPTPGSSLRKARAVTYCVSGYESTEYFFVSGSYLIHVRLIESKGW
jgi:hypothetical protein